MASEQQVPVERVGSIIDMFAESTGLLSSAGGQGQLIFMADSPEQLVRKAHDRQVTIYYDVSSDPDNISTNFERKYLVALPEVAWEWKESIPVSPDNVTAAYNLVTVSNTTEPSIYRVSYEKDTGGSMFFALVGIMLLTAIGACIVNWLWGLVAKD